MKPYYLWIELILCGCGKQEPFVLRVPGATNQADYGIPQIDFNTPYTKLSSNSLFAYHACGYAWKELEKHHTFEAGSNVEYWGIEYQKSIKNDGFFNPPKEHPAPITIEEMDATAKEIAAGIRQMRTSIDSLQEENALLKDAFKRIDYLPHIYQSNGVGPWVYLEPTGTNHTANLTKKP